TNYLEAFVSVLVDQFAVESEIGSILSRRTLFHRRALPLGREKMCPVRQGEELSFNFVKRVKMQPEQRERSRNDGCEFTSLLAGSSTYQRRRDFRKEKGPRNNMLSSEDLCKELLSGIGRVSCSNSGTFMQPGLDKSPREFDSTLPNSKSVVVKAKPISPSIARRLPGGYVGKDFVKSLPTLPSTTDDDGAVGKCSSMAGQKDNLNKLSAQLLRAEIMGNAALARKLKDDLRCHKSRIEEEEADKSQGVKHGVALAKFHARKGTFVPAAIVDESEGSSVQELLWKEKTMSTADESDVYGNFPKATSSKVSEDWTVDDVISERKRKLAPQAEKNRKKQVLIKDFERSERILNRCPYCFGSSWMNKHLVVAVGFQTYLALPPYRPFVDGQCCILPRDHVTSCVQMDEDVFEEINMWRKGLVAMFHAAGKECIFMENARNVQHMPHTCVECFPISPDVALSAPAFFKKAIMECDEEWADNKRLVDLSLRDIQKSIPRGFSYFAVYFGLRGGFAHVIENENLVSPSFGQEVLGGMLDVDYSAWRNPVSEKFQLQLSRTKQFKSQWAPYDWTEKTKSHP
ncbi:hypothetical protein M514_05854, partial [Trichuris suis]